jgi:hypothetical protein
MHTNSANAGNTSDHAAIVTRADVSDPTPQTRETYMAEKANAAKAVNRAKPMPRTTPN